MLKLQVVAVSLKDKPKRGVKVRFVLGSLRAGINGKIVVPPNVLLYLVLVMLCQGSLTLRCPLGNYFKHGKGFLISKMLTHCCRVWERFTLRMPFISFACDTMEVSPSTSVCPLGWHLHPWTG
eukprot:4825796-Amphidinium_carterae.2